VTKKKEAAAVNPDAPLAQLILDCKADKYRMVSLATRWAVEVQKRESQTPHQPEELVAMALKEILSGKISMEDVEKLPPAPKLEKKLEVAPVISEDLAKRIAEEDARAEKAAAKTKKDDDADDEEEEEEDEK
jgi:DNA-directed RNA polymerase subunit K/omega